MTRFSVGAGAIARGLGRAASACPVHGSLLSVLGKGAAAVPPAAAAAGTAAAAGAAVKAVAGGDKEDEK